MKKILIICASILLAFTNVNAIEKRIGIAAGFTNVEGDGTETLKDSSKKAAYPVKENIPHYTRRAIITRFLKLNC